MKQLLPFVFILLLLAACKSTGEITDGSTAFALKKYQLAQQLLPGEINKAGDSEVKLKKSIELAKSYALANEVEKAAEWYEKAIEISNRDQLYFDLGKIQKRNEQFEDAIENFNIYQERTNDVYYSSPEIRMCEQALAYDKEKSNISIENVTSINSEAIDYATALYEDNQLAVSSTRSSGTGGLTHPWTGQRNSDIYVSEYTGSKFGALKSLSDAINTDFPEGGITFSADYSIAYFSRCDFSMEENGYCHLYRTQMENGEWQEPTMLSIFGDTISIGQPFLTKDSSKLFFVADAPFGFGGNDIYFMANQNGVWSDPYNAGFSVNTEGNELFPTVTRDGRLYYSSDGRTGYGGLDIFTATPVKQNFSKSEHLPYPINSGGDDFGFLLIEEDQLGAGDGILEQAILSSSRTGGKGFDDVYIYTKKLLNFYALEVSVIEKKFADPEDSDSEVLGMQPLIDAKVTLTNLTSNETEVLTTSSSGKVRFDLEPETDYKVFVEKSGYFNQSIKTSTKNLSDASTIDILIEKEVELEKIFPEKEILIPDIYYDYDKATLRAESLPVLDTLVSFFEENSDLTIEIGSHTDSRGSDSYNEELSQRRAQSVVDYLISKGVPSSTLRARGYGESKLTNRCANGMDCSEDEHQENRRTTFRVSGL